MGGEEDGEAREKVKKYMRMLGSERKIGHALRRLAEIDMTLELLSETGVGKAVNKLRNHDEYAAEASQIVERWKEIARSYGLKQKRRRSPSSSSDEQKAPQSKSIKEERKSQSTHHKTINEGQENASYSGLSFADMLARADTAKPLKSKKLKVECNDWKSSKVDVNYRPSKVLRFEPTPKEHHAIVPEAATMDVAMFKPRKTIRKIYAGRPKCDVSREVPTLQQLCVKVLIANIDSIDEVGDTPYFLLKPVLEKCSAEQLSLIEKHNPQFMQESDELWERIVNRAYPKCKRTDGEKWRECYNRICKENNRKLKMLSTKITQHNRETNAPVKTALLADAKAPREVRRRQLRYGTGHTSHPLPSASEISKARKEIFDKGNKEALASLPVVVRNATSSLGSHSEKKKVVKKGALMMKTLKMLNAKRRK